MSGELAAGSHDAIPVPALSGSVPGSSGNTLSGVGEMADRVRSLDWAATALGPVDEWSPTLLATVNMILSCPLPMQLFWGPEFIVLYNDALIPIMTTKHPHALGRPAKEVWAEAWAIVGPQMEGVRETGQGFYHQLFLVPIQRDGTMQDAWWDYSYSPVFDPSGEVQGVLDVVRDVTQTVLAAEAKRESDERLELAMEAADLGFWSYNAESGVVFADDRMHRIFGSPDRSGSVAYWLDLLHPDDSARVGERFAQALAGTTPYDLEYRIVRPDGIRWIRSKGRLMSSASRTERMFAVVEDVTDRKVVESALQASEHELRLTQASAMRSEEQLRVITDALPSYISYLDHDLRYVRVNKTYEEWFRRPAGSIVGKTIDEVLGAQAASAVRVHLQKALAGERDQFEYTLQIGEEERVLSVVHLPDLDPHGVVRGVIVQGRDVTEQKRAEAALIQSEKLAAVGRLAASIAHEINNPLESVTNLLFLARTAPEAKAVQEYLELAERELRRVSVISSQTLRFYRQSTQPRPVTCGELFESVLSMYQGRLVNSNVQVERQGAPGEIIQGFEGEIRQVVANLIGNAIDAMHPDGGRLIVKSRRSRDVRNGVGGVTLTVADTGPGMPASVRNRIFEAFYTTKGIGGTGLGLWVSKEIVERHHGSIRMRSSQRKGHSGTVFAVFIPQ